MHGNADEQMPPDVWTRGCVGVWLENRCEEFGVMNGRREMEMAREEGVVIELEKARTKK